MDGSADGWIPSLASDTVKLVILKPFLNNVIFSVTPLLASPRQTSFSSA